MQHSYGGSSFSSSTMGDMHPYQGQTWQGPGPYHPVQRPQQSVLLQTITACSGGLNCGQDDDAALAMCTEPAGGDEKNWVFVGEGKGGYNKVQGYNYVGNGQGAYDAEDMVETKGRRLKPACLVLAGAAIIGAAVWLANVTGPNEDDASLESSQSTAVRASKAQPPTMTPEQHCRSDEVLPADWEEYCCRALQVRCSRTRLQGIVMSSRPQASSAATPVRAAVVPAVVQANVSCTQKFAGGCGEWAEHNMELHYQEQTEQQCADTCHSTPGCGGFFFGAQAPFLGTCSMVKPGCSSDHSSDWNYFDCQAGSAESKPKYDCEKDKAAWIVKWSIAQKEYCCKKTGVGCAPAVGGCGPPPVAGQTQPPGASSTTPCAASLAQATALTTSTASFDCDDGFANCKASWSVRKEEWCKENKQKACPGLLALARQVNPAAPEVPPDLSTPPPTVIT